MEKFFSFTSTPNFREEAENIQKIYPKIYNQEGITSLRMMQRVLKYCRMRQTITPKHFESMFKYGNISLLKNCLTKFILTVLHFNFHSWIFEHYFLMIMMWAALVTSRILAFYIYSYSVIALLNAITNMLYEFLAS